MRSRVIGALVLLGAAVLSTVALRASDRIGVYAVVEKTTLEPNDTQPVRIQIWGAFAQAVTTNPNDYNDPQRGYLYYTCPAGQESTCRKEWSDITSVAGKGTGIGFGSRFKGTGRIRKADEKPSAPDPYPIEMGVMKLGPDANSYHSGIASKLNAALRQR
jgi:hypothetical protein